MRSSIANNIRGGESQKILHNVFKTQHYRILRNNSTPFRYNSPVQAQYGNFLAELILHSQPHQSPVRYVPVQIWVKLHFRACKMLRKQNGYISAQNWTSNLLLIVTLLKVTASSAGMAFLQFFSILAPIISKRILGSNFSRSQGASSNNM